MKKIIGNWKCNQTLFEVVEYFEMINHFDYDHTKLEIGIAVPDVWLFLAKSSTKKFDIIAQNVNLNDFGSFTGTTSCKHLNDIGIKSTIIGHSEVRKYLNENNEIINKKILTCLANNIKVILCIGEPIEVYENDEVFEYLVNQLSINLANVNTQDLQNITIAYEPIWAIGTNKTPTVDEIENIIILLKQYFDVNFGVTINILYGGSVNISNVASFSSIDVLDGFLIGTASLNPKTLIDMVRLTQWDKN